VVVDAGQSAVGIDADGSYTTKAGCVSIVMTADCLPVLICNRQGTIVAAVHQFRANYKFRTIYKFRTVYRFRTVLLYNRSVNALAQPYHQVQPLPIPAIALPGDVPVLIYGHAVPGV